MITIKQDLKKLSASYKKLQKRQIPFAASQALNDVAFDAQRANQAQIAKKLDRPTRFTVRGFRVRKSTKRNLRAIIFIDPRVDKYLQYQIDGGTRVTDGRGTGVPTSNARLNKHGNIPGRRKGLIKNKRQFIATIKGISGVWERARGARDRRVKLIVAFETRVKYRQRYPFEKINYGVANRMFSRHFATRMARAISTAR